MSIESQDQPQGLGALDEPADAPLVDVSKRTVRRWMESATDTLQEETDDSGWQLVGFHGLRRAWATQLRSADVDAMVVCDWGGWNDRPRYVSGPTHTPETQRRERQNVESL